MKLQADGLEEAVSTYLQEQERDSSLAWYLYMGLRTEYPFAETDDPSTVRLGGRDEYPDTDALYNLYASSVRESGGGDDTRRDGPMEVVPAYPRVAVQRPSLDSYAAAFNEFVDEPGMEETIEDYIRSVWEPYYRGIEPVWEFLHDVQPQLRNEEDLLELAEGYADGFVYLFDLFLQEASGEAHTVEDMQDFFEHYLNEEQFWLGIVHRLEHGGRDEEEVVAAEWGEQLGMDLDIDEGFSLRSALREEMMDQMDDAYHVAGTEETSVYHDGDAVYVIDSADKGEKRMEPASLTELVQVHEELTDGGGNVEGSRAMLETIRDVYKEREIPEHDAEVFHDPVHDTRYVYDKGLIMFHAAEVVPWLDDVPPAAQEPDDEEELPLFERVMEEQREQEPA
ncbi:MAG: hypothetical protein SVW02_04385 [Candidatus Nanohaloarchaea archaeon]|nr:hypothetical protein [Candidatus Nanohaloarchaea archaeon]